MRRMKWETATEDSTSKRIRMRKGSTLVLSMAFSAAFATHAQVPDELLQSNPAVAPQTFHEGTRGDVPIAWSLIPSPDGNGLGCSVVFTDAGGLVWITGPADAGERAGNTGWLAFGGGTIPPSAKPRQVTLSVRSNADTQTMSALHVSLSAAQHMLRIPVNIRDLIRQNEQTMHVVVDMDGRQVFASELVELKKAYARLEACMGMRKH